MANAQLDATAREFHDLVIAIRDNVTTQGAVDQVTRPDPLLDALQPVFKSGHGESLTTILETEQDETSEWTDRSGTKDVKLSGNILDRANVRWSKPLLSHIRIAYQDLEVASSPEALANLAEVQMRNCQRDHRSKISNALTSLYWNPAKPTDPVNPGPFTSLDQLVSDVAPLGGVDPSETPVWKATRIYRPEADFTVSEALRDLIDGIEDAGGETAGLMLLAGKEAYRRYENELDPKVRYTSLGTGDTRFREIEFQALPVRRIPQLQGDRIYAINTASLIPEYLKANFMKVMPQREVPSTLDYWTPLATILALSTERRADHGLLVLGEEPADRKA